ncbi:bifunctional DNA-formamidopyrimidine glycosylase/DNA-(apurinic or apyrimidinic site) lyase [Aquibacillus halophilus]|uniref:Formamidopyrimidine-DNA glycosylase n=1 Tax=Aquibacillus halophilus TaxID=930132 RepID=A0A6A8DDB8_9BACI|nr:bifunctional DNA-formamidopyrimidine glycosylase/DNA-(apurinic or apyrimidinic site) lyase [Aquibacillus halophilus]MRH42526.1 bifunctional DNA-formamidopyrimidine glycosylase/DNA-(apurinic or apyrimidinic site) lyase [Aquibacillus halophilus]
MPELPEMENYKKLLVEKIKDNPITAVEVNREKSINTSVDSFRSKVGGSKIEDISRRAKYLLFHLDNGEILLLHLMLGGWMYYGTDEDKPDRTIQVKLSFGEKSLYFIGLRLGYLNIYSEKEIGYELQDLGPEPLDINFSLDRFLEITSSKRGKVKNTLVDQHFLSGIGNRYSDEVCWHAQINPNKQMNDLEIIEKTQLYQSIRHVLAEAIQYGGYMGTPLFKGDKSTGGFLNYFKVYNREGESCQRCGAILLRQEVSSRKTFYCPNCQK